MRSLFVVLLLPAESSISQAMLTRRTSFRPVTLRGQKLMRLYSCSWSVSSSTASGGQHLEVL